MERDRAVGCATFLQTSAANKNSSETNWEERQSQNYISTPCMIT